MKTFLRYSIIAIVLFAAFAWLNNTSLFSAPGSGAPVLLAHRGLAQTYTREDLERDTCTATRINPPEHAFIENTIASMQVAFAAGASVVEFDVHPTTDGNFAVFHDWTLDCRTEGHGRTRDHAIADLKKLDVGHGYTSDGGQTFPLRGKGVGLMPSLDEVLNAFPAKRFLINVKSNDASEGEKLAAHLAKLPLEARSLLMVYGGTSPVELVREKLPDVAVGSKRSLQNCILRYILLGWSGHVSDDCRAGLMLVPLNVAPWLWGWPDKFLQRMDDAGVQVFVLGPYDGGLGTSGIDDVQQLSDLPSGFTGGIWTNRIDRIGAAARGNAVAP